MAGRASPSARAATTTAAMPAAATHGPRRCIRLPIGRILPPIAAQTAGVGAVCRHRPPFDVRPLRCYNAWPPPGCEPLGRGHPVECANRYGDRFTVTFPEIETQASRAVNQVRLKRQL